MSKVETNNCESNRKAEIDIQEIRHILIPMNAKGLTDVSRYHCPDVSDMESITLSDQIISFGKHTNTPCFEWEILKECDTLASKKNLESSSEVSACFSEEEQKKIKDWDLVSNVEEVISFNSSFDANDVSQKNLPIRTYKDAVLASCIYCKIQLEERKIEKDLQEDLSCSFGEIFDHDDDTISTVTLMEKNDEMHDYCKSKSSGPILTEEPTLVKHLHKIKPTERVELYDAYFDRDCYKNTRGGKSTMMYKGNSPHSQWRRKPSWMKDDHIYKKRIEIRKWSQRYKQLDFNCMF